MTDYMDTVTGVYSEDAFHHLLTRETWRATRYHDSFSLCLVEPDVAAAGMEESREEIVTAMAKKISEFVRSTDLVGRLARHIGIVLLYTSGEAAISVANRIGAHIEQVAFTDRPAERPVQLTLSIGEVSFPQHGHDSQTLFGIASKCLEHASNHGGNCVVYASELEAPRGLAAAEGAGS